MDSASGKFLVDTSQAAVGSFLVMEKQFIKNCNHRAIIWIFSSYYYKSVGTFFYFYFYYMRWRMPPFFSSYIEICRHLIPSVLWHCWLADRKGIWLVKKISQQSLKFLEWPSLTWNDLWKIGRLNKINTKVAVVGGRLTYRRSEL